ncbi:hypothetical protein PoB_004797900 [Plakobranchus ocellatus]|uniref:Uncharacterized protein n=1 Tax=Plakobranchus ocellatus TaxID=259542 RepID=A0AAV4BRK6_9GAST|nr:hypothetical protein PoB_004797900 [Plakobranchus ocellatus]
MRKRRRGGAASRLPAEDRGSADHGPSDSFPHWGPRQRDSRRTSQRGKVNAKATKPLTLLRFRLGVDEDYDEGRDSGKNIRTEMIQAKLMLSKAHEKGRLRTWAERTARLSCPPSGQGAGGGARICDRRVPTDLRVDSLSTAPPTRSIKIYSYYS